MHCQRGSTSYLKSTRPNHISITFRVRLLFVRLFVSVYKPHTVTRQTLATVTRQSGSSAYLNPNSHSVSVTNLSASCLWRRKFFLCLLPILCSAICVGPLSHISQYSQRIPGSACAERPNKRSTFKRREAEQTQHVAERPQHIAAARKLTRCRYIAERQQRLHALQEQSLSEWLEPKWQ